ncbi:MAG: leucine-rich repeat domain-containing protein [Muribaculaceae bacterium]|nr:leucine-rich repeat domain-containing protein [Muribaculaceae bacterium]MBQ7204282.1 leucine-rich repeat domain-containing protein [Muribaculaceae bacterium]
MKHIRYILLLPLLALCCALSVKAQDIEASGIYYNIIGENQVEVTSAIYDGVNHYEGCIILPEKVYCDGVNYDVTAIAPRAFWRSAVTEVQIPNSVTMIGDAAFADAEDLTDITLPLGLTAVSRYMLAGTALSNVVLPEGVTDVGKGAFEDCTRLHTVFLPVTLRRIGDRAFGYCSQLAEIYCDAPTPPQMSGIPFEGCEGISVMLADNATARQYQNDNTWGDEDTFSLWIDEGLAVLPTMQQECLGQHWTALTLGDGLAYKIYGPDGYLMAVTAADRYFLPIGAQSTDYLVVPTTLMYDEEALQLVATAEAEQTAIEEVEQPKEDFTITGLDGTIYINGDTHGLWTFIYDVYGNLWYERPAVNNWISLPGQRVYVVKVGDTVRKVFLN